MHEADEPDVVSDFAHADVLSCKDLVGWTLTLETLAQRMRCTQCGEKAAEVVAVARPRPRGIPKNRH